LSDQGPFAVGLRERIRAGDSIGCIWLALGSAAAAELAADTQPDAIVFDLQHGLWERQALEGAIGVARTKAARCDSACSRKSSVCPAMIETTTVPAPT